MVGAVLAWRKKDPEQEKVWSAIGKANKGVEAGLARLNYLAQKFGESYVKVVHSCSTSPVEEVFKCLVLLVPLQYVRLAFISKQIHLTPSLPPNYRTHFTQISFPRILYPFFIHMSWKYVSNISRIWFVVGIKIMGYLDWS